MSKRQAGSVALVVGLFALGTGAFLGLRGMQCALDGCPACGVSQEDYLAGCMRLLGWSGAMLFGGLVATVGGGATVLRASDPRPTVNAARARTPGAPVPPQP
jgi:hypothetical protein